MNVTNVYGPDVDLSEENPSSKVYDLSFNEGLLSWTKVSEQTLIVASNKSLRQYKFSPLDGVTYPTGLVIANGVKVVYRGRGESVDLSSLIDFSGVVRLYAYSFNGVQSTEKYNSERVYISVEDGEFESFDDSFDDSFE